MRGRKRLPDVYTPAAQCELCGAREYLHVDHDHITGRIRGTLCVRCNTGLGKFGDNPARLRAAAAYLERGTLSVTKVEYDRQYQRTRKRDLYSGGTV